MLHDRGRHRCFSLDAILQQRGYERCHPILVFRKRAMRIDCSLEQYYHHSQGRDIPWNYSLRAGWMHPGCVRGWDEAVLGSSHILSWPPNCALHEDHVLHDWQPRCHQWKEARCQADHSQWLCRRDWHHKTNVYKIQRGVEVEERWQRVRWGYWRLRGSLECRNFVIIAEKP